MADLTLAEISEKHGLSLAVLRKDVTRGKLKVTRDGSRISVVEGDLAVYLGSKGLDKVVAELRKPEGSTKALTAAVREVGNLFGNLPDRIQSAILEGLPTSKKPGSSEPFLRVTKAQKGQPAPNVQLRHDDPHWGHPIGYQHKQSPRWKRINESTWELDGVTWSWNGMFWEGGGRADGRSVDLPVSPGHTASDMRPLAPSHPVKR